MIKIFKKVANEIATDSISWNQQFEVSAPYLIAKRRKSPYHLKNIPKVIISIFFKPKIQLVEELYVFQGLRSKNYIGIFKPEQVLIIGSHDEKKYAEKYGYRFSWSFPIESAVQYKIFLNFNISIVNQLKYWLEAFSKPKRIIFFLNEDTQPLGIFLIHLSKIMNPKSLSVCIQHGIFYKMKSPIRADGGLSDINFVWDYKQADIINCNRSKTYEIGLPYVAQAKLTDILTIIFIGPGTSQYGTNYYENIIKIYENIYKKLIQNTEMNIFYRPHPNEFLDYKLIQILNAKFSNIDKSDKITLLNGPKTIFIGTISSLMYEASIAGHPVARLKVPDEKTCDVECDLNFCKDNIDYLIDWVKNINNKKLIKLSVQNERLKSPTERFIDALRVAEITKNF